MDWVSRCVKSVGCVILLLDTMNVIDVKLCMEVLFIAVSRSQKAIWTGNVHIAFCDLDPTSNMTKQLTENCLAWLIEKQKQTNTLFWLCSAVYKAGTTSHTNAHTCVLFSTTRMYTCMLIYPGNMALQLSTSQWVQPDKAELSVELDVPVIVYVGIY